MHLTKEQIDKYLESRYKHGIIKISPESKPGLVNGLWTVSGTRRYFANGMHLCSSNFMELKLTGTGDVMKESMNVTKTLVWRLLTREKKAMKARKTEEQGIPIRVLMRPHQRWTVCRGAIVTLIYSLITNKKVKNDYALTGEINLQGNITEIGGLDLKIIGGIEAGVKHLFILNLIIKIFLSFRKYEISNILDGISFNKVETIEEVLDLIIVKV